MRAGRAKWREPSFGLDSPLCAGAGISNPAFAGLSSSDLLNQDFWDLAFMLQCLVSMACDGLEASPRPVAFPRGTLLSTEDSRPASLVPGGDLSGTSEGPRMGSHPFAVRCRTPGRVLWPEP